MASFSDIEVIDAFGDLILIVGTQDQVRKFQCRTSALCVAIPRWETMLWDLAQESYPLAELSLPADDSDALLILLQISHLQFKKVPKTIEWKTLVNLAKLCYTYDTVGLVRRDVEGWIELFGQTPTCKADFEGWVSIN